MPKEHEALIYYESPDEYEANWKDPRPWRYTRQSKSTSASDVWTDWRSALDEWNGVYLRQVSDWADGSHVALWFEDGYERPKMSDSDLRLVEFQAEQIELMRDLDLTEVAEAVAGIDIEEVGAGYHWVTYPQLVTGIEDMPLEDTSFLLGTEYLRYRISMSKSVETFGFVEQCFGADPLIVIVREAWQAGLRTMLDELMALPIAIQARRDADSFLALADSASEVAVYAYKQERDITLRGIDELLVLQWTFPLMNDRPAIDRADTESLAEEWWRYSLRCLLACVPVPFKEQDASEVVRHSFRQKAHSVAKAEGLTCDEDPTMPATARDIVRAVRTSIAIGAKPSIHGTGHQLHEHDSVASRALKAAVEGGLAGVLGAASKKLAHEIVAAEIIERIQKDKRNARRSQDEWVGLLRRGKKTVNDAMKIVVRSAAYQEASSVPKGTE